MNKVKASVSLLAAWLIFNGSILLGNNSIGMINEVNEIGGATEAKMTKVVNGTTTSSNMCKLLRYQLIHMCFMQGEDQVKRHLLRLCIM